MRICTEHTKKQTIKLSNLVRNFKGGRLALKRVSKLNPKTCSVCGLIYSLQFSMGSEREERLALTRWCLTVLLSQAFHWPYLLA